MRKVVIILIVFLFVIVVILGNTFYKYYKILKITSFLKEEFNIKHFEYIHKIKILRYSLSKSKTKIHLIINKSNNNEIEKWYLNNNDIFKSYKVNEKDSKKFYFYDNNNYWINIIISDNFELLTITILESVKKNIT